MGLPPHLLTRMLAFGSFVTDWRFLHRQPHFISGKSMAPPAPGLGGFPSGFTAGQIIPQALCQYYGWFGCIVGLHESKVMSHSGHDLGSVCSFVELNRGAIGTSNLNSDFFGTAIQVLDPHVDSNIWSCQKTDWRISYVSSASISPVPGHHNNMISCTNELFALLLSIFTSANVFRRLG